MSYPHFPRPPMNSYSPNLPMSTSVGQTPPPLTVIPTGTTVLAYYQEFAWYFGIIQNYNLTRNGTLVYQVLFRSGEIRSVASSQVLSQQSNNQNIEIGSRVVVQHPTKSMLISSLVAELPSVENIFRYLLFLDDGSACYKTKDKLWVINLVENPIHLLPPAYKSFIQRYFTMTGSSVTLLNLSANDSVNFTNYNDTSLQFAGKVAEVDCSIALVRYSINTGGLAEEWIHRGSSRILSYGHHANPYYIGDLEKHNGTKHMSVQNLQSSALPKPPSHLSNNKRYIKSPLKSKQYMVPPSLDPFMFSDEEHSTSSASKSGKHSTFNTWPVSNSTTIHGNSFGQMFSPRAADVIQPPQSPIVVLDESPAKDPPPYSSPPMSYFPDNDSNTKSSPNSYNDNFLSPSSLSLSPQKPVSVFSWSAPEETGTRRRLELSPKINADVDFDFSDTILNAPVNSTSSVKFPILNDHTDNDKSQKISVIQPKLEEIIVIDEDDPILNKNPPVVIETKSEMEDIVQSNTHLPSPMEIDSKNDVPTQNANLPMILHQEACSFNYTSTTAVETSSASTQNGNIIEVVVHGNNNGETFISVAPTIEIVTTPIVASPTPIVPTVKPPCPKVEAEIESSEVKSEVQLRSTTVKSRKRRMMSPLKPLKNVPKIKTVLKGISETSKDLAAQKCVKRARKQQSKDANKDSKQALVEKKKKIAQVSVKKKNSLFVKKEPIKINCEAKIARWFVPWSKRILGSSYHPQNKLQQENMFGKILQKMDTLQNDEELEEGEIDESDSDADDSSSSGTLLEKNQNSHKCSLLCNRYSDFINSSKSPLYLPIQYGWKRIVRDGSVSYISPCGVTCMMQDQINNYLYATKCTQLYTSHFCFKPEVSLELSSLKPDFEPLFSDNDLSNGMESVPISFISNVGPIIKYNFHYVIDPIFDVKVTNLEEECASCTCEVTCTSECLCKNSTPPKECNNGCGCSMNCANRVIQRGLQQQLQIIQEDTVFHVRTMHDIPSETFICSITGVVRKSCPENKEFIFPLCENAYKKAPERLESESGTNDCENLKTNTNVKSFYHDDSSLIVSTDLEIIRQRIDRKLGKYKSISPYWARTALKHNSVDLLTNPAVSSGYSSLCIGRRDNPVRLKKISSCSTDNPPKPVPDMYLDCTEYGNIGRFIPLGENFNTEIQPVFVDNPAVPWLAIYSTCTIPRESYLLLKSFDR